MRRADSSVKSNIAEGQGRMSKKDQARFATLSYSSLVELFNHLITALDQNYIQEEEYLRIRNTIEKISSQLSTLKKAQLSQS